MILHYHLPFADEHMLDLTVDFLQQSHSLKLDFSTRDGINVLRLALKRAAQDKEHPLSKDAIWLEALKSCLGDDALDLESLSEKRQQNLGGNMMPMGLGDFFFSPDNPLHPDRDDDDFEDFEDDEDDDNY